MAWRVESTVSEQATGTGDYDTIKPAAPMYQPMPEHTPKPIKAMFLVSL